jgi:release factor glutamine methyltransferase
VSLRAALVRAVAALRAAGVEDAAGDARRLAAHALGVAPDRLTLILDDPLPDAALQALDTAIAARAARRPVSRIIGRRAFWRHEFVVTDDVLDPRPETETLVAEALAAPFRRVVDLGTGSGCILLSCLAGRPQARGLGTDLSAAALDVARRNAEALGLADRAAWHLGTWWEGVEDRFDLVLSNPPYIAADEMAGLAPEVRDWDPHLALTPGGDGLQAYRVLAAGLSAHLAPGGRVLLEIGPTQGPAVRALLAAAGLGDLRILPDLDGRDRVVAGRFPG